MRESLFLFFFQAEDGIRDKLVTGVQTCALPICWRRPAEHQGAEEPGAHKRGREGEAADQQALLELLPHHPRIDLRAREEGQEDAAERREEVHPIGKLIMASTFVTDFGTALALALLFIRPTWWLVPFLGVSVLVILAMVTLQPWFFSRYGERVIEPEIKGAVAALLVLMFFADKAQSHALLPAFVLGLALARIFHEHPELTRRFRVVAFALLTPFFFLRGGMNVSLRLVWANLGLLVLLFAVKQVTKIAGVYPLARRWGPIDAIFVTLLMSTGLTFGTISSLYGLNAGILDRAQFSVLVTTVVASAVIPTIVAQRWFSPGTALEAARGRAAAAPK